MIKFLIQHASALEEKDGDTDADMGGDFDVGAGTAGDIHLERSRVTQGFMRDIQGID